MRISDWSSDVCSSDLGLTAKRMGQLARSAIERAPELTEWIEPGLKSRHDWPDWREALARLHADPSDPKARDRLAYDEVSANQLELLPVRGEWRGRTGQAMVGDRVVSARRRLPTPHTRTMRRGR